MTKSKDRSTPLQANDPEQIDHSSRPRSREPEPERTAAGEQHVLPGAERISDAELAKRRAEHPLKPKAEQKSTDEGLFSDESKSTDGFKLYHATTVQSGETILRDGFRDARGRYGTDIELVGVFLSDRPLDMNEGTAGETVLMVSFPPPVPDLADYELIEEGKPYREWCIPANIINRYARVERDRST